MSVDPAVATPSGPWTHRMVAANGSRLHVALTGPDDADAPLVVLLHGFPQFWWAWRHQLVALGEAGYRAAAMDLRGYGASDKPARTYSMSTLTSDVAGVIGSLGAKSAVVVGNGIGGQVAWSLPGIAPDRVSAIAVLGSPHPLHMPIAVGRSGPPRTMMRIAQAQVPWFPERSVTRGDMVATLLQEWGAPGWRSDDVDLYTAVARLPFAAHSQIEQIRWLVRSRRRQTGRSYREILAAPVTVPVLSLHGREDGMLPPRACLKDGHRVLGRFSRVVVDGAGHFLPEERPEEVTALLTRWLQGLG